MGKRNSHKEFERLSKKTTLHANDEYTLSETSAIAAKEVVFGHFEQLSADSKRGGSANKRKEGIWSATAKLLEQYPDATARELWEKIPDVELEDMRWGFELDGNKLLQTDGNTGKIQPITFDTFRKEYFAKAKKLNSDGD